MTLNNNKSEPTAPVLKERNSRIRTVRNSEFTSEQSEAVEWIKSSVTEGIYNLVGDEESGKTFIAQKLTMNHDSREYFAWLPVTEKMDADLVFIDNVAPTRIASRRAREVKTFNDVKSVVALSDDPVPEAKDRFNLKTGE
jgi:adenylate kinase